MGENNMSKEKDRFEKSKKYTHKENWKEWKYG